MEKPERNSCLHTRLLIRDPVIAHQFKIEVRNRFDALSLIVNENSSGELDWSQLEDVLTKRAETELAKKPKKNNQRSVMQEILELMDKRRHLKNKKTSDFKMINNKIGQECTKAKQRWIAEKCEEIENLEQRDIQLMYSKIKIMTKTTTRTAKTVLTKKDEKVVIGQEEVLKRWVEHIGDLFRDEQKEKTMRQEDKDLIGNEILKSEIEAALKQMENQKSPGNDKISKEMLACCKKIGISKICSLANKIYDSGIIPKQMKESIFIPIPKKGDLTECGNY